MVDLRLPRPTTAVDEAPRERVAPGEIGRAYDALAAGVQNLGSGLEDLGVDYAKKQGEEDGQKLITRNPDGSLSVENPKSSFIVGRMGQAYDAAVSARIQVAARSEIDMNMAEMARKFEGDPQGFRIAAGAYVDERAGKGGELGKIAMKYGQGVLGQHYAGLVDGQARRDLASSSDVLNSRLKMNEDRIDGLAAQGDTSSPAYQAAVAERRAIQESRISNPLYGYNDAQRNVDDELFQVRLQETAVVARGRSVFEATKNFEQAVNTVEEEVERLPISQDRKIQLLGKVRQNLASSAGVRAFQNQQLKDESQTTITNIQLTGVADHEAVTAQAQKLEANRLFPEATALRKALLVNKYSPAINHGTAEQQRAALQEIQAGATKREGGVSMKMVLSGDQRDLVIRTAIGEAGGEPELGQEAVVHVIKNRVAAGDMGRGVRGVIMAPKQFSVWNSGDPAGDVARGAAPGSAQYEAVGAIVDRVFNGESADPTNGAKHYANPRTADKVNVEGWIKEKAAVGKVEIGNHIFVGGAGAVTSTSSEGAAYRSLLADAQSLYNRNAKTLWHGMEEAFQQPGYVPSKQEMADLKTLLPLVTDDDLRKKISEKLTIEATKERIRPLPLETQQAMVESGKSAAAAGDASATERALVTDLAKDVEANEKLAKEDPVAYAQRRVSPSVARELPPVTPLDMSSPQGISATLDQRRQWAGVARSMDPQVGMMPLTGNDVQQITAALPSMPAARVQTVLGGMVASLRPEELQAVLANKDMKDSIVGLTRSGDAGKMGAAFAFLDAQERANPVAFRAAFGTDVEKNMALWKAYMAYKTPEEIAKIIQRRDDPAAKDAYKAAQDVAGEVTDEAVVKKFGSWVPFMSPGAPLSDRPAVASAGLARDYKMHYADYYAGIADKSGADAYAMEQVKKKWGETRVGGNRIMAYPPENHYPKADNSHDYIGKQLDAAIAGVTGVDRNTLEASKLTKSQINRFTGARSLVPDDATQADIAANRPPSYQIVIVDPQGRPRLLTDESTGRPMRFRADHDAAMAPVRENFDARDKRDRAARAAGIETATRNADAMRSKLSLE